ncbi:transposase [Neobacillus mesonae]|nr:transposase [Neobacillus mesonae]
MVLRMQLDPARLTLLMGFFDTYLQLTKEEEEKVIEEVKAMSAKEGEKVMEIISSYERRGREEGREEALLLVAKKMKEKGKTAEEIAEFTGFLKEEIEKL